MSEVPLWPFIREVDDRASALADELPLLSVSQTHGVRRYADVFDKEPRAEDLTNYKVAQSGDLVVNRMSADKGALGVAREPGLVSPDYMILRTSGRIDVRYLAFVLKSSHGLNHVRSELRGIGTSEGSNVRTPRVSTASLLRLRVRLAPDGGEQIADYLDHETAEIDAFIADLSILKAFTAERHRSLQRALFTPDGAISMPIKRVSRLVSGSGFPPDSQGQAGKELPFFKVSSFAGAHDGVLADSRDTISPREAAALSATVLPSGSVVMAKIGAALFLGRTARLARAACIDNNLVALVPNRFVLPEYLQHAVQTVDLAPLANPGAVPSLNMQWFRDSRVRVPDLKTQALILEDFERASMIISDELADIDAAIALAKERRAALITAAVTGQIDVSGFGTRAARATQPPGSVSVQTAIDESR